MDLVVEGRVIVEIKAVERILPVHDAQVLTYLPPPSVHSVPSVVAIPG